MVIPAESEPTAAPLTVGKQVIHGLTADPGKDCAPEDTKRGQKNTGLMLLTVVAGAAVWYWLASGHHWLRFDARISLFLNYLAGRWWTLDRTIKFLQSNDLPQGTFAMAVFYYVWFQSSPTGAGMTMNDRRERLLFALLMCVPAVLVARAIAVSLPYRVRPIFNPDLHLRHAYSFDPTILISWSCFPSDHAVFYFALATGIFLINRKAGILLYLQAALVICLPRLYLGVHYLSDVLVGTLLGCGFGYLTLSPALRSLATRHAFRLHERSLGLFHAALFCFAYETAHMYENVRHLGSGLWQVGRALLHL